METSRQFRHSCLTEKLLTPEDEQDLSIVTGRIAYNVPAGLYRHMKIAPNGAIEISEKAFVDDVVAFMYYLIKGNANIPDETKNHLKRFVIEMDNRAIIKHGYSHNEAEKNLEWKATWD